MNIQFKRADITDTDILISVQNKSFYADFIKYGVCPGYNRSHSSMVESIKNNYAYKIVFDGSIIGDIIIKDNGSGDYFLGCLCVIPEYENRGIGQLALQFMEHQFPHAKHWSLETPSDNKRNLYFYQKHGYRIINSYLVEGISISFLKKTLNA